MFPSCIDCFDRQKRKTKVQQTNKEKPRIGLLSPHAIK